MFTIQYVEFEVYRDKERAHKRRKQNGSVAWCYSLVKLNNLTRIQLLLSKINHNQPYGPDSSHSKNCAENLASPLLKVSYYYMQFREHSFS